MNVVRWSSDGRFLASGSDDCYILIYRYTPDAMSNQPYGSSSAKNKENWSRCFTLQGHVMDVLDISWSSLGLLASASVDNKIIIWDFRAEMANVAQGNSYTTALISPFRVLSGHLSFVKGVSFDPVGRYETSAAAAATAVASSSSSLLYSGSSFFVLLILLPLFLLHYQHHHYHHYCHHHSY